MKKKFLSIIMCTIILFSFSFIANAKAFIEDNTCATSLKQMNSSIDFDSDMVLGYGETIIESSTRALDFVRVRSYAVIEKGELIVYTQLYSLLGLAKFTKMDGYIDVVQQTATAGFHYSTSQKEGSTISNRRSLGVMFLNAPYKGKTLKVENYGTAEGENLVGKNYNISFDIHIPA